MLKCSSQRWEDALRVLWKLDGAALSATVSARDGHRECRLIVEQLPERRWDWTVWRRGSQPGTALHGEALSAEVAMSEAEQAAKRFCPGDTRSASAAA
jgi:hypothetical protein